MEERLWKTRQKDQHNHQDYAHDRQDEHQGPIARPFRWHEGLGLLWCWWLPWRRQWLPWRGIFIVGRIAVYIRRLFIPTSGVLFQAIPTFSSPICICIILMSISKRHNELNLSSWYSIGAYPSTAAFTFFETTPAYSLI